MNKAIMFTRRILTRSSDSISGSLKLILCACFCLLLIHGYAQESNSLAEEAKAQREIWNRALVHDSATFFSKKPNRLLVSAIKDTNPGKALDIGMGQGRNSIFLAERGWDVTGIDVADEAVNLALAQAKEKGLTFTARLEPMQTFDYGIEQWDLIVHVYEGCLSGDSSKFEKIVKALKPRRASRVRILPSRSGCQDGFARVWMHGSKHKRNG